MLSLILSLALVAVPPAHVTPGVYRAPHRADDGALESEMPDAHLRVWLGLRAVQGGQGGDDVAPASYPLSYVGRRCGKTENAVSKALVELKRFGWVEEVGRDGKQLVWRCHVGTDYRRLAKAEAEVAGSDYWPVGEPVVPPHGKDDSASREEIGGAETAASCLTGRNVPPHGKDDSASREDSPAPPNKESSCLHPIGNPEQPSGSNEGARGSAPRESGGDGGGEPVVRMEPTRPDQGVNGNALARQIAEDSPGRMSAEDRRALIVGALPGYEGPPAVPASAPPSVERSREDAEVDAAIAELPAVDRSRLLTSATRKAKRQWPGAWPGDRDPAVRQLVARLARELFAEAASAPAAAEEAAQPQDS